jgi:hypothetical protein
MKDKLEDRPHILCQRSPLFQPRRETDWTTAVGSIQFRRAPWGGHGRKELGCKRSNGPDERFHGHWSTYFFLSKVSPSLSRGFCAQEVFWEVIVASIQRQFLS